MDEVGAPWTGDAKVEISAILVAQRAPCSNWESATYATTGFILQLRPRELRLLLLAFAISFSIEFRNHAREAERKAEGEGEAPRRGAASLPRKTSTSTT